METQVVIIGGGAAGTMVARELSKYKVDVILVEKHPDVSFGISKASNGYIYWGISWFVSVALKAIVEEIGGVTKDSEIKKERWVREGFKLWRTMFDDLDMRSMWSPFMMVATSEKEMNMLERVKAETIANGLPCRNLSRDEILSLEPNVTPEVIGGIYDDEVAWYITYPFETVIAVAENAKQNGVRFMVGTEVTGFSRNGGFQIVETTRGPIKTEFIINATGADGARVAKMADACDFSLQFFKAHLIMMDKKTRGLVNGSVSILAGPGRVKGVNPVPSGNLCLSTIYTPTNNPHDLATDKATLDELFGMGHDVVPALSKKDIISYFAVSRVYSARDPDEYIIEFAPKNPRFMNMVLRMPGFIPAPAIARDVVEMLADHGLPLPKKDNFNPHRKGIPRFSELSNDERSKLIAQNPKYGHVVCRCETVTEGEIVEAIRRGATTVDGVKFRTRAGMGRCQSGFCGPRVVEILARELNIKPTEVTKKGGNSWELLCETKGLMK